MDQCPRIAFASWAGGDVVVGQVGDRVHGFAAGPLLSEGPTGPGDLDRQRGVGKPIPAGTATSFTVRVSTRPWLLLAVVSAGGTCFQGTDRN